MPDNMSSGKWAKHPSPIKANNGELTKMNLAYNNDNQVPYHAYHGNDWEFAEL
jgi:hypothetical protein